METWTETIERYIREGRTVSGGKGGGQAQSQDQQELAMQQEAFNAQQAQLSMLNNKLSPFLSGNIGFSPQQMSAMTSQFLNNNNQTFNQAGQQVRASLSARGLGNGNNPAGGGYAQGIAPLMSAQAQSQSQGLLGLNVQNAQQALANQFNAANVLSGNAATLTGTQGVAGNAASNALNAYIQAQSNGFFGQLGRGLGQGIGQGLGAGFTGGIGTLGSAIGNNIGLSNYVKG